MNAKTRTIILIAVIVLLALTTLACVGDDPYGEIRTHGLINTPRAPATPTPTVCPPGVIPR